MFRSTRFTFVGATTLAVLAGSFAFAQSTTTKQKDTKPTTTTAAPQGTEDMPLPPGMTMEDVTKCMAAATPGEMHAYLTQDAGTWKGTSKMWMAPGTDPMTTECTSVVTPLLDGRFVTVQYKSDMGDMGPFEGYGIYGYDNVLEKFQGTWVDSMGTTMAFGVGELNSANDKLTWKFAYTCPITEKPTTMREIETRTGKDAKKLEIFVLNPKTGEEYKAVEIDMKRTSDSTHAMSSTTPAMGMISNKSAEVGCGKCSYNMTDAKGCVLATKIDGKTYQVTGSDVNCHQFCGSKGPKPAVVSGKIVDGKFVATDIEMKDGSS